MGNRPDTTHTLIWTAGTTPTPFFQRCHAKERGRIIVDDSLEVKGSPGVWAIGDCALVPDKSTGKYCPPTARHALRECKVLAHNLLTGVTKEPKRSFSFATLGQLAALGRRTGVASILGKNFQGFIAWSMANNLFEQAAAIRKESPSCP